MNTKVLAMTIVFTAITIFLNPRFSGIAIPSFVPGLWFQIWEIPVFTAFLILGLKSSVLITILNTIVLQAVSPGVPFNVPTANLLAVLATLFGMYFTQKSFLGKDTTENKVIKLKKIIFSTFFGSLFRVVTMLVYIYVLAVLAGTLQIVLPLFSFLAIYDIIVVLYSIPVAYVIVKIVHNYLRLKLYLEKNQISTQL